MFIERKEKLLLTCDEIELFNEMDKFWDELYDRATDHDSRIREIASEACDLMNELRNEYL